jgi:hypothetical protein
VGGNLPNLYDSVGGICSDPRSLNEMIYLSLRWLCVFFTRPHVAYYNKYYYLGVFLVFVDIDQHKKRTCPYDLLIFRGVIVIPEDILYED